MHKGKARIALLYDVENLGIDENLDAAIHLLEEQNYYVHPKKLILNNISQLKKSSLGNAIKKHKAELVSTYATKGKNLSDFRLYIEALDILHKDKDIDGFCIVSGDLDFSELAIRLSLEDKLIIGIAPEQKVNEEYTHLFDNFYYLNHNISKTIVEETSSKEETLSVEKKEKTVAEKTEPTPVEKVKKTTKKKTQTKKKAQTKKKTQEKKTSSKLTKSDKKEEYYQELKLQTDKIINKKKNNETLYISLIIPKLRKNSSLLNQYKKIAFEDFEQIGFELVQMEKDKRESTYINTK